MIDSIQTLEMMRDWVIVIDGERIVIVEGVGVWLNRGEEAVVLVQSLS